MMINKRLIGTVRESKKYIAGNVVFQWCSLVANIVMMATITGLLGSLFRGEAESGTLIKAAVIVGGAVIIRYICTTMATRMGYLSSKAVNSPISTGTS